MKQKTGNLIVALAVVIALSFAVTARAQPRDNPIERARHHMELGQEAFSQGRFDEAAEQFVNAFAASPFSAFLYNAGLAQEKAGNNEKAIDFYRRYLESDPEAKDYAQVDMKIRALLSAAETPEEARPEVAISEVEMKSLISVRSNPPDATIRILDSEGNVVSRTDGSMAQTVDRGIYTVEASHPDYRTVQTDISVAAGQVYIVVVEMSQGAFLGFLHVTTDVPGAAVFVDDKNKGKVGLTPWGNVLPTGPHKVWIEKPGYRPIVKEVNVNLGEEIDLALKLERTAFGTLLVKTNIPAASVYVDDALLGVSPLEEQLEPGQHKVKIAAEGMKDYDVEVAIARGQRTKMLVRMNPKPSRTSAWVSLGFAVALFAGGGVAGYMALDLRNELDKERNDGTLANDDSRIMHGFIWGLSADLAFGVGTIVGGLSIYYFLRDPLPPSEGKLFAPIDFTENPDNVKTVFHESGGPPVVKKTNTPKPEVGPPAPDTPPKKPAAEAPPAEPKPTAEPTDTQTPEAEPEADQPTTKPEARLSPRLHLTPILGAKSTGLGLTVVF